MSGSPNTRRLAACLFASVLLCAQAPRAVGQLVPIVWSGNGDWSSAGNWTLGGVAGVSLPLGNHTATVAAGSVSLAALEARTVGAIALSGGTLGGGSGSTLSLTADGSTWTGGTLNGSGTVAIQPLATLAISGTGFRDFSGRTIENFGTVNWTGGELRSGNAGQILNRGTWNDSAGSEINNNYSGATATFTNAAGATYAKSGTGTSRMEIPFFNAGSVTVSAGTLALVAGGTFSAGSNTTVSGGGVLALASGTFTLDGALGASNFTVAGGTIAGNHTLGAGTVVWQSGNFNSAGTTTVGSAATLELSGASALDFSARTFSNLGTIVWSGGTLQSGNAGGIMNLGTFTDSVAASASHSMNSAYGGSTATFTNTASGTYAKTGGGTTTIDVPFLQSGTINVQAGTLRLDGGGTFSGNSTATVAAGASLLLTGGTFTLDGALGPSALVLDGATVAGNHTLGAGVFTWATGDFNTAGTTTIPSGATLAVTGTGNHNFNARTFSNQGTIVWSGGTLQSGNAGGIMNLGTFTDSIAATASHSLNSAFGGSTATFTNTATGTYAKTGDGTSTIDVPFLQSGTIDVQAGTLRLDGGGTFFGNSTATVASGASLLLTGGTFTLDGTVGASALTLAGAAVTGNGTLGGGTFTWQTGHFNSAGTTTVGSAATLLVTGTSNHDHNGRTFVNQGTITWDGGTLQSGNAGGIVNQGTFADSVAASATHAINSAYGGSTATFTNTAAGTYTKAGEGTTVIDVPFYQSGAINVQAGTLRLDAGGTFFGNSTATVGSGAALLLTGGTFTLSGTVGASTLTLDGAVVAGGGTFGSGTLTWQSGNFNHTGTTTIGSGAVFVVAGGNAHDFNGHTLVNEGTVNWTGGALRTGNAGAIQNRGQWNDSAGQTLNNAYSGTTATFTNQAGGTYTKSGSALSNVDIVFNNSGNVSVTGGTLELGAGGTAVPTSRFTVDSGATLRFAADYTIADGGSLLGKGTVELGSGTLALSGRASPANLVLSGGTLSGTHAFGSGTTVTWNGGNLNSAGTTTVEAGATLVVATTAAHDFDARALVNQGTVQWDAGALRSGHGGSVLNQGLWIDGASDLFYNVYGGATPVFTNAAGATYRKTAAGTTTLHAPFQHAGHVDIQAGTLSLHDGGTFSAGSTSTVATGASLLLTDGTFALDGVLGAHGFTVAGGAVTGNHTFGGGTVRWTSGHFNSAGTTTVGSGATFVISGTGVRDFDGRTLLNLGTVEWTGGVLRSGHGGNIRNQGTWLDSSGSYYSNDYGGTVGAFVNTATGNYTKSGNVTSTFHVPFDTQGTVNITAGTLDLSAGGSASATAIFNLAESGRLKITDTYAIADASALRGKGVAELAAGTLTLPGRLSLANLTVSGGSLAGSQTLAPGARLEWNGGNLNALGTSTTVESGATFVVATATTHDFNGRSLVNQGTFEWKGGTLRTGNAGGIDNLNLFLDSGGDYISADFGGTGSAFTNRAGATYRKTGTDTTDLYVPLHQAGHLDLQAGTLRLHAGGSMSSGATSTLGTGALLDLRGGTFALDGTLGQNALTLTGGTITGNHTFSAGTVRWQNGTFNSAGTTTVGSGATLFIETTATHDFDGRAFVNNGVIEWTGGHLRAGHGATILNNQQWRDTASGTVYNGYGGDTPVFTTTPTGSYVKSGAGTTVFDIVFNQQGTLAVSAGTLELSGGGTLAATANATLAAGTALKFSENYVVENAAVITGAGNVLLTGGTLTLGGNFTGNFSQSGGTLAGNHTFAPGTVATITNGSWATAGTTTVAAGATVTLTDTSSLAVSGRTLVNHGTLNWSDGNLLAGQGSSLANHSTLNDTASGTLYNAFGGNASFTHAAGATYAKTGNGTTTLSVPSQFAGNVTVSAGTLRLDAASTLAASSLFTAAAGTNIIFSDAVAVQDAARLTGAGTYVLEGGTLTLDGILGTTLSQTGGTLAGNQTIGRGGNVTWSGGNWNGNGTTVVGADGVLSATGTAGHDFSGRTVVNQGTFHWTGGDLRSGLGGSFVNAGTFNDSSGHSLYNAYGGAFTLANSGTYNKTAGTSHLYPSFANTGTVSIQGGTLNLAGGGSSAVGSSLTVGSGGSLGFTGGNFTLAHGSVLSATGGADVRISSGDVVVTAGALSLPRLQLSGGTLTVPGELNTPLLTLAGGTLKGAGNVAGAVLTQSGGALQLPLALAAGNSTWSGGNANAPATVATTIPAGARLTIGGATVYDFDYRTLVNQGTLDWTSGQLRSGHGGGIANSGTFHDTASASINAAYGSGATFANSGTYTKSAAGTTTVDSVFANTGTVRILAGEFVLSGGGTNAAGATITIGNVSPSPGATIGAAPAPVFRIAGGNFTFASTAGLVDAGGVYQVSGGSLAFTAGDLTLPNFALSGGTVSLPAAFTVPSLVITGGSLAGAGSVNPTLLSQSGGTLPLRFSLAAGNSTWSGGNWNAAASTGVNLLPGSRLAIGGASVFDFDYRSLANFGTIDWNSGQLRTGHGGGLVNTGTFNDNASNFFNAAYGGGGAFGNSGTYNKTAPGTTTLEVSFLNTGLVRVLAGELVLSGGGSNAAGATITVGPPVAGTGAGAATPDTPPGFRVAGGNFTFASTAGLVDAGGTYRVSGGNLTFTAGDLALPNLAISGGKLSIPGALNVPLLAMSGGELVGAGSFGPSRLLQEGGNIAVPFVLAAGASGWSNGSWNAAAPVTAAVPADATLAISGPNLHDFNFRTVTNAGRIEWSAGHLRTGNGGGIVNAAGATFRDTASAQFGPAYGGSGFFTNQGTYEKAAAGTTYYYAPFHNQGTLSVTAGVIEFGAGGSNAAGAAVSIAPGAGLKLSGGTFTLADTANITGAAGNYTVSGGTLAINSGTLQLPRLAFGGGTISGPGSVTVGDFAMSGGALAASAIIGGNSTWTSGHWNGPGTVQLASTATLDISTTNVHDFNQRSVANAGTITWREGALRSGNGSSFVNQTGAVFLDSATSSISAAYGGSVTFTNQGTYQKTAGSTLVQIPFINAGSLVVSGGTLRFTSNFTSSGGNVTLAGGATLTFDQGLSLGTSALAGSGTITGNVTAGGLVSPGSSPGALAVTGNLTLLSTSRFLAELHGPAQGTDYDFLSVGGTAQLAGTLDLAVASGFADRIAPSATFTILQATTLTGSFANVATTGLRIFSTDGLASFRVNFGPGSAFAANSVVLSDFVAVPEPSTYALLGLGAVVILFSLRRRR